MPTTYDYQRVTDALTYSRDHFEEAEVLFTNEDASQAAQLDQLKQRWQKTLAEGSDMAAWVKGHHRLHTEPVFVALEELAKYGDVRRPFRLSVIGQKGVGKSALVNALLGATDFQYTPSEVAGKAVSGTRIRMLARPEARSEEGLPTPTWRVVFLTPRRLWEVAQFLLNVARLETPKAPSDLDQREAVLQALSKAVEKGGGGGGLGQDQAKSGLVMGSATQIQAVNARQTLERILQVYREQTEAKVIPDNYRLDLDDPDVDGPISSYIRQGADDLYLIVDYVERYLEPSQAGLLAGRAIELEDVLGLDDPRDSFFALEAFRESFAVIMVFKCDRGLNTESSSILQSLFSRDETELARFGNAADLNKAIIVANQFDTILANVSSEKVGAWGSPLKGIEDIRRELSKYTRQPVPLYLTSASVARAAQSLLEKERQRQFKGNASETKPVGRSMPVYNFYLEGLSNLLQSLEGQPVPEYLEFIQLRRDAIEENLSAPLTTWQSTRPKPEENRNGHSESSGNTDTGNTNVNLAANEQQGHDQEQGQELTRSKLILELSGLPRLAAKVREALESGSILRGRVANAEYYYGRVVSETALVYARHMGSYKLGIGEFAEPSGNHESRLFLKFQHETRQQIEWLEEELRREWFEVSRRYIYGPHTSEVENARKSFLDTISQVVMENRQLIQLEQHISTGQLVTDAWRKVFEDVNDWLALEAGHQMRSLVGPALQDIEGLAGSLQKKLTELAAFPLDDSFWTNYRQRLTLLNRRLQDQAETLALAFYTDNRFSVYDVKVAETLHVGDAYRRRSEVIRLLQERTLSWFSQMYQLVAKVSMTNLNSFVNDLRYYVLGLPAANSLLVGLELSRPGSSQLSPDDSLISLLNLRYQTDETFRRQYAMREPTPAERVALEIRGWLVLIKAPLDGLGELSKAITIAASTAPVDSQEYQPGRSNSAGNITEADPESISNSNQVPGENRWPGLDGEVVMERNSKDGPVMNAAHSGIGREAHWLTVPVETNHPFKSVARQIWEIKNPDENAVATRLHFSRIDLGNNSPASARIILDSQWRKQPQVISGQQRDFWSDPIPGRSITVRFIADNAPPAWGFVLDGVESASPAEAVSSSTK